MRARHPRRRMVRQLAGRLLRSVLAAAGGLLALTAVPIGLLTVDRRLTDEIDWTALPSPPITSQTALLAATGLGWVLWSALLYVAAASVAEHLRRHRTGPGPARQQASPARRRGSQVRLPALLYKAVAATTGAVMLLVDAVTSRAAPNPQPPPTGPTTPTTTPSTSPATTPATTAAPDAGPLRSTRDRGVRPPAAIAALDDRGWLPAPAAALAAAAAAMLWQHRRRRYQPRPAGPARRSDPDLTRIPAPRPPDTETDDPPDDATDRPATDVALALIHEPATGRASDAAAGPGADAGVAVDRYPATAQLVRDGWAPPRTDGTLVRSPAEAFGAESVTVESSSGDAARLLPRHEIAARTQVHPQPGAAGPHSAASSPQVHPQASPGNLPVEQAVDWAATPLPGQAPVMGCTTAGWLTTEALPHELVLVGPGAADAARGLLVAIATHHAVHGPNSAKPVPTVTLSRADAATLLGPAGAELLTNAEGIDLIGDVDHGDDDRSAGSSRRSAPTSPAQLSTPGLSPPLLDVVVRRHTGHDRQHDTEYDTEHDTGADARRRRAPEFSVLAVSIVPHPTGSDPHSRHPTGTGWEAVASDDRQLPGRACSDAVAQPTPQTTPQRARVRADGMWHVSVDGSVQHVEHVTQSRGHRSLSPAGRHHLAQVEPAPAPQRLAVLEPASAAALLGMTLQVQRAAAEPAPPPPGPPASTTSTGTAAVKGSATNGSEANTTHLPATNRHAVNGSPSPVAVPRPGWSADGHARSVAPPRPAQDTRRLHLRLLGPPAVFVRDPDGAVQPVRIRRSAGLLITVYLAVHRQGADSDELKEALWPDVAGSAAMGRLSTTLSDLRTALHRAAGAPVLLHTLDPARTGHAYYWLEPARIQVDLWQLHDLLDTAATLVGGDRLEVLRRAAALPSAQRPAELAEGRTSEWLMPAREATARHLVDLYHELAAASGPPDAVDLLHRAIGVAPHTESLYQALMRRLAETGDHDAVRSAYLTLTDRLAELHRHPSADTKHLATTLIAAAPPAPDLAATQRADEYLGARSADPADRSAAPAATTGSRPALDPALDGAQTAPRRRSAPGNARRPARHGGPG